MINGETIDQDLDIDVENIIEIDNFMFSLVKNNIWFRGISSLKYKK